MKYRAAFAALAVASALALAGHPAHAKAKTCVVTAQPAALVSTPQQTVPAGVHLDGDRSVILSVTIKTNGSVGDVRVLETSGIADLDAAAMKDAKKAKFSPAIANCVAVTKDYVYKVNYASGATPSPAEAAAPQGVAPVKGVFGATCATPDKEATMTKPVPPEILAGSDTGDGLVILDLTIDSDGDLASYTVVKSSGSPQLDNAAYMGAKSSKYSPKFVKCVPVTGHYKYRLQIH